MKIYYHKRNAYNQEYGKKDPLYINNFGYYEGINEDISVLRPTGRLDYQLIYVSSGELRIRDAVLKDGDYCIFAPNVPQIYTYSKNDNSRYYWVHFTGSDTKNFLNSEYLTPGIHTGNSRKNEADALFLSLSQAIKQLDDSNSKYTVSLLKSIFLLFSSPAPKSPFLRAKKHLENVSLQTTVSELAKLYNMSPEHFIRSFKSAYGTSPANYRITHQLSQAKNLLSDTQLSVMSVAEMCGFSDAYYFSRLFKKHIGVTPTGYRKQFYI